MATRSHYDRRMPGRSDRGDPPGKRPRPVLLVFLGACWRFAKSVPDVIGVVDIPENLSEFRCLLLQVLEAIDLSVGDLIFLLLLCAIVFWPEISRAFHSHRSSRSAEVPSSAPGPASSRIEIDADEEASTLMLSGPSWFLFLNTIVLVKQDDSAYIDSISASWDGTRECSLLTTTASHFGLTMIPQYGPIPSIGESHTPTKGYLVFDCGPAHSYTGKSIFDGIFYLRIQFTDGPECECRCKAIRIPEGVPGRDSALNYAIEVLRSG